MTAPLLLNLHSQTTKSASVLVRDAIGVGKKYGSGVRRVIETFVTYGLPEPLFESTQRGIAVTVFKQIEQKTLKKTTEGASGGASGGVSGGVNTAENLLTLAMVHPGLNVADLVRLSEKPQRTIERWLKQLKDQNLIEFRGATKTGGYYSKGNDNT